MAIFETLYRFSQDEKRVLLLMATGTGKTFTVFQLAWKLMRGSVLRNNRILFLTDRNSLKDQAYRAFAGFPADERVVIDKERVAKGEHLVGKVFFANYQNLDEELGGKKLLRALRPGLLRCCGCGRVPPFRIRRLVRRLGALPVCVPARPHRDAS